MSMASNVELRSDEDLFAERLFLKWLLESHLDIPGASWDTIKKSLKDGFISEARDTMEYFTNTLGWRKVN